MGEGWGFSQKLGQLGSTWLGRGQKGGDHKRDLQNTLLFQYLFSMLERRVAIHTLLLGCDPWV